MFFLRLSLLFSLLVVDGFELSRLPFSKPHVLQGGSALAQTVESEESDPTPPFFTQEEIQDDDVGSVAEEPISSSIPSGSEKTIEDLAAAAQAFSQDERVKEATGFAVAVAKEVTDGIFGFVGSKLKDLKKQKEEMRLKELAQISVVTEEEVSP